MAELYTLIPFFKGATEGEQMFAITKRLGKLSKSDKNFFKDKVPYDVSILNNFDVF